jgi:penicillin-binding protein 2
MKWREHAIFAAFAPVENPEIAIAIVSENDGGGGGAAAAPIAGKILNRFFELKKEREAGRVSTANGEQSGAPHVKQ